ncbi:tlde1 domain-containing protein [Rhizobium sp. ZK1]|uniref:tlde1 domain-containing protein n=1 Tax=Rhizobium sp. ZK1 TaxID=3389872 RepID=UPI0039F6D401
MAFAVGTFNNVAPFGGSPVRSGRSRGFLTGIAIAGLLASTWLIGTVATMQSMSIPFRSQKEIAPVTAAPKATPVAVEHERLIHVNKASRLAAFDAKPVVPLTAQLIQSHAEKTSAASNGALALAKTNRLPVAVAQLQPVAVSDNPRFNKDDTLEAPATVVETASAASDDDDRIIIPSKEAVAAAEMPAMLALTEGGPRVMPAPVEPAPVNRAAAPAAGKPAEVDVAEADGPQPFDLVLAPDEDSVPLPMARPDGLVGRPAPASKGSPRAAEPVLAYAKPNSPIEDGQDDAVPRYDKPVFSPRLRAGVAIYDIENATVYLPNGERLEAHSGLGKMRDNPRYIDQKMRGPTPPHTYNLTMREALFHGVAAIRLTPVQGSDAIFNRVGLLAHTYMLGKNGDSNGCISFKDYKRFLAAYKRGDIRQIVVVPRMNNKPASTLASLFSSRT